MLKKTRLKDFLILNLICLVGIVLLICLPSTVYGAQGTLGTVVPDISCAYYDADGNEVDGNALTAGSYDMTIKLSGTQQLSVVQVTASHTDAVTFESTPKNLMTSDYTDMSSMGYVIDEQNLVFGFVSNNSDTSLIEDNAVIATLGVTFTQDCDAADVIQFSTNPNETFVLSDYADGYNDEYALVSEFDGYNGVLYQMTSDVSPVLKIGYNVSGSIVVMTDSSGSTNGNPVGGEYVFDIYKDAERTDLLKSVKSIETIDESGIRKNTFNIEELNPGTYYVTLSSKYAITRRDITIIVSDSDIADYAIPIIACDFDESGTLSGGDAAYVYANAAAVAEEKSLCYDLDGSNTISGGDAAVVYACSSGELSYGSLTIQ